MKRTVSPAIALYTVLALDVLLALAVAMMDRRVRRLETEPRTITVRFDALPAAPRDLYRYGGVR